MQKELKVKLRESWESYWKRLKNKLQHRDEDHYWLQGKLDTDWREPGEGQ